jgi:two-component system response regulator YesN
MNLVIADDEYLVRASLASMIKEMEASWELAGEAANGEELLELVAAHRPNIAIVDIRMPKMNGLEAIRRGKEVSPLTKWIILSGFSDFAYAQEALKLGASEYLLKPVDPANLEKALQHIYKDNKDYVILLNQQFENQVFAFCNVLTSPNDEDRDSLFCRGRFTGWMFCVDTASRMNGASPGKQLYDLLRAGMNDYLVYGMNLALTALPNGDFAAIAVWDADKGSKGKDCISRYEKFIQEAAQRFSNEHAAVTVLHTEECTGFSQMNERLLQLQSWSALRGVHGFGACLGYVEISRRAQDGILLDAGRLLSTACQHLQAGLYLQYQKTVNELEQLLERMKGKESEPFLHAMHRFIRIVIGIGLTVQPSSAALIRELKAYGETVLHEKCVKEAVPADLVEQVLRYTEEHYAEDIGIGQIAAVLDVSPNYLSTLFHKKTGVTFVKHLTKLRMLKAKELLLSTNLQVKQVAEQVGYYSTRHFTKLFTEAFGRYPSDIRESVRRADSSAQTSG